mmetsp:Transcript_82741/g.208232  ORF Transcript_82741/g.208232 Transcript_82741/m.208232 type:complete len:90 (-) Transcript_82741:345-614(-)
MPPEKATSTPSQDSRDNVRPHIRESSAVVTGARVPMMATTPAPTKTMALLLKMTDTGWLNAIGTTLLKNLAAPIEFGKQRQGSRAQKSQ